MKFTTLPEPHREAQAISRALQSELRERIRTTGAISFAEYMAAALYHERYGYYRQGQAIFGEAGDFQTAPESSVQFGRALARQFQDIAAEVENASLLEFGAGSGALAESLLMALPEETLPNRYLILETSAALRQRQQRRLRERLDDSRWQRLDWIDAVPPAFNGLMLANEVLDALPVERFRLNETGDVEQCVVETEGERLTLNWRLAPSGLIAPVRHIEQDIGYSLASGYHSELSLELPSFLAEALAGLDQGLLLLIDYGYPRREYYLPERRDGTLVCYHRHRMHESPLWWPGLSDITAHVDFTAVAEAAVAAEATLYGYTSQAWFLLGLNIALEMEPSDGAEDGLVSQLRVASEVKSLLLPGEMGERFQCLGCGRGLRGDVRGFDLHDLSHRL